MTVPHALGDAVDVAIGKRHRDDPALPRTGGPAGNALLTAWVGLIFLVLLAGELITLLDVNGLISWHIVLGCLLVPVALVKTATIGWRILRYYTGQRDYRRAGPPPLLLRWLGPLVVVTTLGVLGSGLALIALGPRSSHTVLFSALGQRVDATTLHQALFIGFAVAVGLHIIVRLYPAVLLVTGRANRRPPGARRLPGRVGRQSTVVVCLVAAGITAGLVLAASTSWQHDRGPGRRVDFGHRQGSP
jgi:hypothetical protein